MCYQKCRYEDYSGECTLKRDAIPPMDAMCTINDTAAENAMLRELVRDMFTTISRCGLDTYPSNGKKRELADRMRKFGIEVEA